VLATGAAAADEGDPNGLIQLGPGDSVRVEVFGQPDMTTTVAIGPDGKVSLPLVGAVEVGGLSQANAGTRIEQSLKTGGFFNDPHVTVALLQSRSQRISVLGQVHTPGRYTIDTRMSLFDVLAQAGGVSDDGADFVYVLRPDGQGGVHRTTVRLSGLTDTNDTVVIERLQGGDTLFVPHAERFYITGEVNAGAMYRLEPGMTVLEAVARAGGITQRGSQYRIEIKRPAKDGSYLSFHAKLSDRILPDDVIRVKESIF
jgi:polysaccharide export outer membrane protein